MASLLTVLAAFSALSSVAVAQSGTILREQIWGTVIFSEYGERTPYILPETNTLTPLGAQQMFASGEFYRGRYVDPPQSSILATKAIENISPYELNVDEVEIWSTVDQFVVASAQAFLQGLYPPLGDSSNNTFLDSDSGLANGSNIQFPMNGYQYPQIYTASKLDMNSIWINGEVNCPMYTSSRSEYFLSSEYSKLESDNAAFYANLEGTVLQGIFPQGIVGYGNAYYIYDYLNYGYIHNTTVEERISLDDLTQARVLANEWVFAMNGNISVSGSVKNDHIRAVAGRTLATRVVEAMFENIHSEGDQDKLTLLFGSFEPMVAFAALADLPSREPDFKGIPNLGSSMVWELFSYSSNDTSGYPAETDLMVRFLFQNGTGSSAELISYPLFGRDPSQIVMSLEDFMDGMDTFVMPDVPTWCTLCSSYSIFCPAFVNSENSSSSSSSSTSSSHHGLSNAVAGVIGAVVALAIAGLLFALAMLVGGMRFYRNSTKRRSELGGFKGGEKLASDPDLTVAKSAVGASVQEAPKGHERVGSWELGDHAKAQESQLGNFDQLSQHPAVRKPSFEDDIRISGDFSNPVKPRESV